MKRKLLVPLGALILVLTFVVYMNQGLFRMGVNYIKYRYLSEDRAAENFSQVEENPFEKYLIEEGDNLEVTVTPPDASHEGIDGERPAQATDPVNDSGKNGPPLPSDNQVASSNPGEEPAKNSTLAQISREYMLEFEGMEANFRDKLEGLVTEAVGDYNSGEYSKSKLADMYLQKGETMEVESDEKFYRLLDDLERKLVNNSFDTNMVGEVESYYIKLKEYEKNRIIDKGMALLED